MNQSSTVSSSEEQHGGQAGGLARHHLRLGGPHQEGGDVLRHLLDGRLGAVGVGHLVVAERRRHGDPAAGEDVVLVERRRPASSVSSPVKPCSSEAMYSGPPMPRRSWLTPRPMRPVEAGARLGHQAEVGGVLDRRGREVVRRRRRAGLAGRRRRSTSCMRREGAHLLLGHRRPALLGELAVGHELEPVAGGADLGVDLQAALQLRLVEAAERPLEGEAVVGDLAPPRCSLPPAPRAAAARPSAASAGEDGGLQHGHAPFPAHSAGLLIAARAIAASPVP